MATTVQLQGKRRTESGKGPARRLRAAKRIPGILYGRGAPPVSFDTDSRDFLRAVTGHATSTLIVDLAVEGDTEVAKTLIRDLQVDPVSGEVLHLDLHRISLTEKIEVEVPVDLVGLASGVKNQGGILQHPLRTLAIRCFADKIPDTVRIDVTALNIGDAIRVRDLVLPDVDIVTDRDATLASVLPPTQEEVVKPVVEAVAAEPEIVGKKEEKGEKAEEGGEKS